MLVLAGHGGMSWIPSTQETEAGGISEFEVILVGLHRKSQASQDNLVCVLKTKQGIERWLRSWVQFPETIWWLQPSVLGSDALFWPAGVHAEYIKII